MMWTANVFSIVLEVWAAVVSEFAAPDPLRFAHASTTPWNWHGENEAKEDNKGGAILVNKERRVFEFGAYSNIEIDEHLNDLDIQELQKRNLDPENPAYANCKAYFSKMRYCTKVELAANSGDEYNEGIKPETAAKVLAAFRAFLVDKPTF